MVAAAILLNRGHRRNTATEETQPQQKHSHSRNTEETLIPLACGGSFPVRPGTQRIHLMIGQAEGRRTPQNGSAARVNDVKVRLFETRDQAAAYLRLYEAQYEPR
jgi:hypothetical protein